MEAGLNRARTILGDVAKIIQPATGSYNLGGPDSIVEAVVGIITRHPMREDELLSTLDQWSPGDVKKVLVDLEGSGKAQVVERLGIRFWSAAPAYFPEEKKENG